MCGRIVFSYFGSVTDLSLLVSSSKRWADSALNESPVRMVVVELRIYKVRVPLRKDLYYECTTHSDPVSE